MKQLKFFLLSVIAIVFLAACKGGTTSGTATSSSGAASSSGEKTGITVAPAASGSAQTAAATAVAAEVEEDESEGESSASDNPEPAIKFLSKGSILPTSGSIDLLFSSVGYAKAEVRIRKVVTGNILQYLQVDSYDSMYELSRVAKTVLDTTIVLGSPTAAHLRKVKTYALDLDEMIKPDPGALYYTEIRGLDPLTEESGYYSDYYFGSYNTYEQRSTRLLASNLALLAKRGDNSLDVFAFDILSGKPVPGAKVKIYDFVQQELAKGGCDREGRVSFSGLKDPYFVVANAGGSWSYLDLKNEKALSTSNFDVSGTTHPGGIKAYIFGERGVWRPGDTLHIGAILMFDDAPLPAGHPVTAELRNPDGQVSQTITRKYDGSDIFHFPFCTQDDAATGRWTVDLKVGSRTFSKSVRIETVKPNRLDIDLSFGVPVIKLSDAPGGVIAVNWLYGAPGTGLKVQTNLEVSPAATSFKGYDGFDFRDDARDFETQYFSYKDMTTDAEGKCYIGTSLGLNTASVPGMLKAGFTTTAFEPTGEFSTGYSEFKMSPFPVYVGIRTEQDKTEWDDKYIAQGVSHKFELATVDASGKPAAASNLFAEIYHVDYSWWWNSSNEIASYMSGSSKELVFKKALASASDGKASFSYDWADAPSGVYYIRVTDRDGGHATSMICDVHERWGGDKVSGAATMLAISCDKESYQVGQSARVSFPSSAGASALISIEKGGRVLDARTVSCNDARTEISVPVTAEMLPNAYVAVTLIQPHGNTLNDAPIRLYGVQNLNVEDKSTRLNPVIEIADEVKPESTVSFKVKEKDGRAMSYVVALVDEGLLSLTGFKTPDAWASFYEKEALRVRTWDMYDDVIGAYGGRIEQLFAIGGDDESTGPLKRRKADRFKPVVSYLGPFTLKGGKTATHKVQIPQYIGSLRAMVIATDGKAQGSFQKDVNVTKPLLVLTTVPRTLGVGEKISIPVTLIPLKDGIGNVKLSIKTDEGFTVTGPATISATSENEGQQVFNFEVEASGKACVGHISVKAESHADKSAQDVEIDILNPNSATTRAQTVLLQAGDRKQLSSELFGIEGSNEMSVEFSSIPPIDLSSRLGYLVSYPYGCIEQTVSSVLPQLYLGRLTELDANMQKRIETDVNATIRKMQSFRRSDGSMSYWPGSSYTSLFGSAYALYFLQEAEQAGYAVGSSLKNDLSAYVAKMVKDKKNGDFPRAYGMFVLASDGKPQRSAMNLMRSSTDKMANNVRWLLAGAYALDGKKDIAREIISGLPYTETSGNYYSSYYGSEIRNMAIAMKVHMLTGNSSEAFKIATELAKSLNDKSCWMSTQSTAWALQMMCDYAGNISEGGVKASAGFAGKTYKIESAKSLVSADIPVGNKTGETTVELANNGSAPVYAVVAVKGIPAAGEEVAARSGLDLAVNYVDAGGNVLDVASIERGTSFKAVVSVTNTGNARVGNIALAERFPSGWEIRNDRVYKDNVSYPAGITYQDFRDDRVYSFFDLEGGSKVNVTINLTAAYPGRFYLPAISCEAMYDGTVSATLPGRWIEVK